MQASATIEGITARGIIIWAFILGLMPKSTDDVMRFEERFRNEQERLENADIDPQDRDAIGRFVRTRVGSGTIKQSTGLSYMNTLRRVADDALELGTPLVDMDLDDFNELCFEYQHGVGYGRGSDSLARSTLRTRQRLCRLFFDYLDREWVEDIEVAPPGDRTIDPDDMLRADDIAALVEAANEPRDVALIEFLADTGVRIGLAGSLRVGDVTFNDESDADDPRATFTPNPNASGLKGADIKPYPLIDSKADLRTYLRMAHPRADEPSAALFHRLRDFGPIDEDDGVVAPSHINKRLREIADKAGIEKPTNPHNFRHSAVTRMLREGWSRTEIEYRVCWEVDTEMWQVYSHVADEDVRASIHATAGVSDPDDENDLEATRHPCGNCRETLKPHARFCPNCANPVSPDARADLSKMQDNLFEKAATETDAEVIDAVRELRAALDSSPEVRELLLQDAAD